MTPGISRALLGRQKRPEARGANLLKARLKSSADQEMNSNSLCHPTQRLIQIIPT